MGDGKVRATLSLIEQFAGRKDLPPELVKALAIDLVDLSDHDRLEFVEALVKALPPQCEMPRVIRSDDELETAVAEVQRLMELRPRRGTADFDRLETLSVLVESYEKDGYEEGVGDPPAGHDDGTHFDVILTDMTHAHNYLGHPQRVQNLYKEIERLWETPRRAEIHDVADMPRCGTMHIVNDPETGNGVVTLGLRFPLDLDRLKS